MAGVYQGSLCNIAAAASRSSDEGCFRTRDSITFAKFLFTPHYDDPDLNATYIIDHGAVFSEELVIENRQPLFSRGWVFQERVLAPEC